MRPAGFEPPTRGLEVRRSLPRISYPTGRGPSGPDENSMLRRGRMNYGRLVATGRVVAERGLACHRVPKRASIPAQGARVISRNEAATCSCRCLPLPSPPPLPFRLRSRCHGRFRCQATRPPWWSSVRKPGRLRSTGPASPSSASSGSAAAWERDSPARSRSCCSRPSVSRSSWTCPCWSSPAHQRLRSRPTLCPWTYWLVAVVLRGGLALGHGPSVSPWARWAGTADAPTVIVCALSGFPGGM